MMPKVFVVVPNGMSPQPLKGLEQEHKANLRDLAELQVDLCRSGYDLSANMGLADLVVYVKHWSGLVSHVVATGVIRARSHGKAICAAAYDNELEEWSYSAILGEGCTSDPDQCPVELPSLPDREIQPSATFSLDDVLDDEASFERDYRLG